MCVSSLTLPLPGCPDEPGFPPFCYTGPSIAALALPAFQTYPTPLFSRTRHLYGKINRHGAACFDTLTLPPRPLNPSPPILFDLSFSCVTPLHLSCHPISPSPHLIYPPTISSRFLTIPSPPFGLSPPAVPSSLVFEPRPFLLIIYHEYATYIYDVSI